MNSSSADVAIIMGSQSDWPTMRHAAQMLDELGVAYETRIVSAHRTPDRMIAFAKGAKAAGFKVIIAGAGGAAHLPGMVAAMTTLPVLRRARSNQRHFAARTACFPSCRCRRAFLSARSPSARPARPMPVCLRRRCWRLSDEALAARIEAWRAASARQASPKRHRTKADRGRPLKPGATQSASLAAASLAACSPWQPRGWAFAP